MALGPAAKNDCAAGRIIITDDKGTIPLGLYQVGSPLFSLILQMGFVCAHFEQLGLWTE
jgi:hypothetical protein